MTAAVTMTSPSLTIADVSVGDELPTQTVDVSVKSVITTALASRDHQDVHHDVEAAKSRGTKTIFMNILSSNGFVLRFVTDWAGPEAIVVTSEIRLGVPNYAGETMTMTGKVTSVEPGNGQTGDGEGRVDVHVEGANSLGVHVIGTVGITLPSGSAADGGAS